MTNNNTHIMKHLFEYEIIAYSLDMAIIIKIDDGIIIYSTIEWVFRL
jgi:hypothetical protein